MNAKQMLTNVVNKGLSKPGLKWTPETGWTDKPVIEAADISWQWSGDNLRALTVSTGMDEMPTKAQAMQYLDAVRARYQSGCEFNTFAPKGAVIVYLVHGWEGAWHVYFSADPCRKDRYISNGHPSEPGGKYHAGRRSFAVR